ncbi:MAG: nuclear transport factor 2 family protein [Stenotrophomonas sp.]|uniref:nuclear transport factor 2 family protein n=1 Tax=Stenotrophomonas sp. TaxID=69392 RepID=UPI003D6CCD18
MNKALLVLLFALAPLSASPAMADEPMTPSLQDTIAALDFQVFDSFNRCTDPAQLQKHAGYFDPAVEFYHDTGSVTWTRDAMLANTRKHVCGNFTRELIPGSLEVFEIKDFGALSRGQHRFCDSKTHACDGLADFTILWRLQDGHWQITRVMSYAHRANTQEANH